MYGVVAKYGDKKGMPIRKPWRIMCKNSCLPTMLNKTCDGSHTHCPCQGGETKLTQAYSPAIAKVVHQALLRDYKTKVGGQVQGKALTVVHVHGFLKPKTPLASCGVPSPALAAVMGPPTDPPPWRRGRGASSSRPPGAAPSASEWPALPAPVAPGQHSVGGGTKAPPPPRQAPRAAAPAPASAPVWPPARTPAGAPGPPAAC